MKEIDKEALVLFRDNSLLFLKNMLIQKTTELTLPEIELIEKAIEYHRYYNHIKLQKAKLKKVKEKPEFIHNNDGSFTITQ